MTPRFLAWATGRMELSPAVGGAELSIVMLSLRYASGDLGQLLAGWGGVPRRWQAVSLGVVMTRWVAEARGPDREGQASGYPS